MAYCVRCGVELAPSEKVCPLCLTPVVIPGEVQADTPKPYPERMELVNMHIDHRYGAKLALIFLAVPMLAVLLCDLAISYHITWSSYVLGAGVCVCCWAILPFYLNVRKPYLYLTLDFLCVAGYLALIAWRTDGMDWYLPLSLPLTLLAGVTAVGMVYLARRKRVPVLNRISNMVFLSAVAPIGVEIITDLFIYKTVNLQWSVYTCISLAVCAVLLRVVERSARLKSVIERRLFM